LQATDVWVTLSLLVSLRGSSSNIDSKSLETLLTWIKTKSIVFLFNQLSFSRNKLFFLLFDYKGPELWFFQFRRWIVGNKKESSHWMNWGEGRQHFS
jgi:hypothetical protein